MEHQEMVKPALIEIHPRIEVPVTCPNCKSDSADIHDYLFEGIHVLVDCTCRACETKFYHTVPAAHDAHIPISVSHDGKYVQYDPVAEVWLAQPLVDALLISSSRIEPTIKMKSLAPLNDEVIILNCLDDCFGHSYVKLLNATSLIENYPEKSLILLITPNFEWLVPKGVAELWIVQASMGVMDRYIEGLQAFVRSQVISIPRCYLSAAKVYHDLSKIDFVPYLKTKPFDLLNFDKIPKTITFVLREDRYWHSSKLDEFMNRAVISLKVKRYFRKYFVLRQNMLVSRVIDLILKAWPGVQIYITGIGTAGSRKGIIDLRTRRITPETEKRWCEVYASSHVVIGVHGSNMLIPTALSAGFIGLLPWHKIPHLGEDTVLRYAGRYAILLGRHLDECASPELVAGHVVDMLRFGDVKL